MTPDGGGILLLDKPGGISSARALAAAKKHLGIKKAGHGGTLDPLASGLLVLLFGEATRYARYLLGGRKRYTAAVTFGHYSDTDDACGVLTPGAAPPPPDLAEQAARALPAFCGDILQTAPAYSALKHQGKPLYHYARRGEAAPAKTRRVHISAIRLLTAEGGVITLDITCGGGVYIRSLARDLGRALGCGAYLSALRRTACGGFTAAAAVTPEALAAAPPAAHLLPVERLLGGFPALTLPPGRLRQLGSGVRLAQNNIARGDTVRVLSPQGRFAGLATYQNGSYRPLNFLHWTRAQ